MSSPAAHELYRIGSIEELIATSREWLPWLDRGCAATHGRHTLGAVVNRLKRGEATLWLVKRGNDVRCVFITQIEVGDDGSKVMTMPHLIGEGQEEWASDCLALLEHHARDDGCARMWLVARRGWGRVIPDYKWTHVILEKEL